MNGNGTSMIEEEEEDAEDQEIVKNLFKIVTHWDSSIISTEIMLNHLSTLANEKVVFNTNSERRKMKDLASNVLNYRVIESEEYRKIKGK